MTLLFCAGWRELQRVDVSYAGSLFCDIILFSDSAVLCRVEGAAAGFCVWCAVTRALGSTTVSWPAMAAPASLKDPSGDVLSTGMRGTYKNYLVQTFIASAGGLQKQ